MAFCVRPLRGAHPPTLSTCGHAAPLRSQASRGSMAFCVCPLKEDRETATAGRGRASHATAILLGCKRLPKGRPRRTRLFPPALGEPLAAHLHGLKPTAPLPSHATAMLLGVLRNPQGQAVGARAFYRLALGLPKATQLHGLKPTAPLVSSAESWMQNGHGKPWPRVPTHPPFFRAATLPHYARKRAGAAWPSASVP